MSLSDKRRLDLLTNEVVLKEEDVKEFIKRLKEPIIKEIDYTNKQNTQISNTVILLLMNVIQRIDKLAGDKLTGGEE